MTSPALRRCSRTGLSRRPQVERKRNTGDRCRDRRTTFSRRVNCVFDRGETATDDEVERIEAPDPDRSIVISCIYSGQFLSNDHWPGRRNRARLAGSKLLPNGEKFWLVWQDCPTTDLEREILREAEAHAARTEMVPFARPKQDTGSPERTLIFKEFPEDRCLLVMDAALLGAPD